MHAFWAFEEIGGGWGYTIPFSSYIWVCQSDKDMFSVTEGSGHALLDPF